MNKFIITIFSCLVAMAAMAQSPSAMLDKCVAATNAGKGITAAYSITTPQGTSKGTIDMLGKQFRILSNDAKCWFDGKTQWAWSPLTDEVNISRPTAQDLQLTNPLAAASHFKANFNLKKAKAKTADTYAMRLTPKKKDNIKVLWLYFDEKTSLLRTARFEMQDKSVYTVRITNYEHKALSPGVFTFDKSLVPPGTQVVDLR